MIQVFRKTARRLGLVFVRHLGTDPYMPSDGFDVFYHHHSKFLLSQTGAEYRGLHLIRDPRDTIVSGCFYHQHADEPWLHRKRKKFGGLSYQEKINSYATFSDKLLFELEHSARSAIRHMSRWDYGNPSFMETKYEDLIRDRNLVLFDEIFRFLGFPDECLPEVRRIAYENSLFSRKHKPDGHIRCGSPSQWRLYFGPAHSRRFLEVYGDVLIQLGYENDDRWAFDVNEAQPVDRRD